MLAFLVSIVVGGVFQSPAPRDSATVVLDSVRSLIKKGEFATAETLLQTRKTLILQAAPSVSTRYFMLAGDLALEESFEKAQPIFLEGIKFGREKQEGVVVSQLYDRMGRGFRDAGDFPTAKKHYLAALQIRDSLKDIDGLAASYDAMGILHGRMNEHEPAFQYFTQAHQLYQQIGSATKLARSFNNLGLACIELERNEDAIANLRTSLQLKYSEKFSPADISNTLNNLGLAYENSRVYDSAIAYYTSCISVREKLNMKEGLATVYNNLGYVYASQLKWNLALQWYRKSLSIADSINMRLLKRKLYSNVSRAYYETGNLKQAYDYLYRYDILNDSIFNETKSKQISELQTKYETEKKEQQIRIQRAEIEKGNAERDGIMLTLVVVILSSAALIYFYRQRQTVVRRLREQDKELYNQKVNDMLKDRHIETMTAMIKGQEQERKRIATDLHDRLGSMLSAIKLLFSASTDETRPQSKKIGELIDETVTEVRKISHDLATGIVSRFGLIAALEDLKSTLEQSQKLTVELNAENLPERLDDELEITIYRIVQELLSNILKHAEATEVTIQLTRHENELNIIVEDNGVGFQVDTLRTTGLGLQNVKDRVRSYSGTISFDSVVGRGTIVNIMMPL